MPEQHGAAPGRVVVVGSLNEDLSLSVARHPRTGETVAAGDPVRELGGKGANQAMAAARAGARTMIIGRVGEDDAGRSHRERLRHAGVDTTALRVDPSAPTGTAVIAVDSAGDNLIMVSPGANRCLVADDLDPLDRLGPDDVVVTTLESPLPIVVETVRRTRRRGARMIVNLAPFAALPDDVLAGCDPVVVNEHEHGLLVAGGGEPPEVLITLGADGSRWGEVIVPAERLDPSEVVDTTGAGDSYAGTLAARLAAGDDRRAAMVAASSAAARTVRHQGAQPPD